MIGAPSRNARAIAFARVAWAATKRGGWLIQPAACISRKPRAVAMNVSPTATGATTTSGGTQPVCSAISYAVVCSKKNNYGLAAFEGIRCYKGRNGSAIFRLREHVGRLLESAHIAMLQIPY